MAPLTDIATWLRGSGLETVLLVLGALRRPDGAVVVVPNGLIVQTTNLSREWARAVVDVPLPVGTDVLEANELLRRVGAEAFEDEDLRPLLLEGIVSPAGPTSEPDTGGT